MNKQMKKSTNEETYGKTFELKEMKVGECEQGWK